MTPRPVRQRSDGYRLVWNPEHPNAHKGYVYEHRLVAEQTVGRPLRRDEIVHHINEDPSDNRTENLEVLTKAEHQVRHLSPSGLSDQDIVDLLGRGYNGARIIREFRVSTHRMVRARKRYLLDVDPAYGGAQ